MARLSKKFQVYPDGKKSNCAHLRNKSGVYLVYFNGELVYIGKSNTDLEDTITRHFQNGNYSQAKFKRGEGRWNVRVALTPKEKALDLEKKMIAQYKPKFNKVGVKASGVKKTVVDMFWYEIDVFEAMENFGKELLNGFDEDMPF